MPTPAEDAVVVVVGSTQLMFATELNIVSKIVVTKPVVTMIVRLTHAPLPGAVMVVVKYVTLTMTLFIRPQMVNSVFVQQTLA